MHSIDCYSDYIESAIGALSYPKEPAGLYAPVKYTLEGGGKRIRPTLLLAAAEAFGAPMESVADQAVGIEMFHNFTLLHDDVMDNADVRRGRPTVHRRWNSETAILSGDAMLTMASMLMGKCPAEMQEKVLGLFNRTAMEIYEGQQYDMDFESRSDVTVEEYMEMIRLKTSVLLACACAVGALMGGASEDSVKALYAYGEKLGLAFQLRDDYLDTYGDPAIFGKEIGGDILNEKKTWLWITAMQESGDEMRQVLDKKLTDYLKIQEITAVYDRLRLPERTCALIEKYVGDAVSALDAAGIDAGARKFFTDLAAGCVSRMH